MGSKSSLRTIPNTTSWTSSARTSWPSDHAQDGAAQAQDPGRDRRITGTEPKHLEEVLTDAAKKGVVEYNWDNPEHVKKYYVQIFVPGIAEMTNMNLEQVEKYPKLASEFNRLTFLPLAGMTEMIPPGGGGAGMHVIPVEKAIPSESQSVSIEHLSHWLKKYEGQIGVGYCSCRNAARLAGQGCGELQDELCISVGTFNRYVWRPAEAMPYPMTRPCASSSAPRTTAMSTR
jgi:hypothetical protein